MQRAEDGGRRAGGAGGGAGGREDREEEREEGAGPSADMMASDTPTGVKKHRQGPRSISAPVINRN